LNALLYKYLRRLKDDLRNLVRETKTMTALSTERLTVIFVTCHSLRKRAKGEIPNDRNEEMQE